MGAKLARWTERDQANAIGNRMLGQGSGLMVGFVAAAEQTLVILGSGMSAGVAARTLREEGFGGRVVLIGPEPTPPFGRPPLSKTYLRGEETLSGWFVNPEDWYEKNRVDRVAATAAHVDIRARRVELAGGNAVSYSRLLITTGGENRRLD